MVGRLAATVMEAFGGPHDSFNSGHWYNGAGGIRAGMSQMERFVGEYAVNYTSSLILAAPFAAAGMIPESSYGALRYLNSRR